MTGKIRLAFVASCVSAASFALVPVSGLGEVRLDECPKCDRRFRVSEDGRIATVNVSRLKDDAPDEATLKRRIADITARAERCLALGKDVATGDRKCPLMGWSSWNTFGVDISEDIILDTARAMATNGLKEAGYRYVNIDDGFFNGHGEDGVLRFHPKRFPNGMKPTVDGIHALGLWAGIYSDAGADTCGSMWGGSGTGGKDLAGGVAVRFLGKRASNDLIWKDVRVEKEGRRTLEFACASAEDRRFRVEIDGRDAGEVRVPATSDVFETFALDVTLSAGLHAIRLSNPSDWMPDVDRMVLR